MSERRKISFPKVTVVLAVVNIVIFLCSDLFFYKQAEELALHMTLNAGYVLEKGEYYRMLTAMFFHYDIGHIMSNMLMLFVLGNFLEALFGKIHFIILYFVSGFVAHTAAIVYNGIIVEENRWQVFGTGASGAIFGLMGAYIAMYLVFWKKMSEAQKKYWPTGLVLMLIGLLFGDSMGLEVHCAGLLTGFLIGGMYCLRMRKILEQRSHGERNVYGGDQ